MVKGSYFINPADPPLQKKTGISFAFSDCFEISPTSCRGFLKLDDFKSAFKQVAPHLPERTVLEAFRFSALFDVTHPLQLATAVMCSY
ncbi:hypothetical protein cypCar_00008723 [Cyprinus carpio]|nr:hypothetical protein cypCar_00008723 [Cyprinus carpio]